MLKVLAIHRKQHQQKLQSKSDPKLLNIYNVQVLSSGCILEESQTDVWVPSASPSTTHMPNHRIGQKKQTLRSKKNRLAVGAPHFPDVLPNEPSVCVADTGAKRLRPPSLAWRKTGFPNSKSEMGKKTWTIHQPPSNWWFGLVVVKEGCANYTQEPGLQIPNQSNHQLGGT